MTASSTLLASVGIDSTLPAETKDAMQGPATDIAAAPKTLGANAITVTLDAAPDADVELYYLIKQGASPAVPPLDPVGAGGGMKLLWENEAPGTSFAAQTVSLSLSGHGALLISFRLGTDTDDRCNLIVLKGVKTSATVFKVTDNGVSGHRGVSFDDAGVTFDGGRVCNPFSSTRRDDNSYCIPVKIYGIGW